jgi:hypothetical protein
MPKAIVWSADVSLGARALNGGLVNQLVSPVSVDLKPCRVVAPTFCCHDSHSRSMLQWDEPEDGGSYEATS